MVSKRCRVSRRTASCPSGLLAFSRERAASSVATSISRKVVAVGKPRLSFIRASRHALTPSIGTVVAPSRPAPGCPSRATWRGGDWAADTGPATLISGGICDRVWPCRQGERRLVASNGPEALAATLPTVDSAADVATSRGGP
jgi:hypothetical protein